MKWAMLTEDSEQAMGSPEDGWEVAGSTKNLPDCGPHSTEAG